MNSHPGLLSSLPASRPSFAFSPMRIDPVSEEQRDQDQLHHQVRPLYMYLLVDTECFKGPQEGDALTV